MNVGKKLIYFVMVFKSNERSEYSYICLADFVFFFGNFSILVFRGLTSDFFKFSEFPLLKGRPTPLSNSKKVKVMKNMVDF